MITAGRDQAGADAISTYSLHQTVGDNAGMPFSGEYAPGTSAWSRKHVEACEATNGEKAGDYLAHEATGDEKAVWWERAVETWPDYANYQKRTKRQIPVFVLEPMP